MSKVEINTYSPHPLSVACVYGASFLASNVIYGYWGVPKSRELGRRYKLVEAEVGADSAVAAEVDWSVEVEVDSTWMGCTVCCV